MAQRMRTPVDEVDAQSIEAFANAVIKKPA